MTQLSSFSARRASLSGSSLAALVLALACPNGAQAQSFNGTGTVTSGSAFITDGPGTTDIGLFSNEVVIDWTTPAPATGTVVFQAAGTTATYSPNSGFSGDFTVLNRVIPVDVNGAPTAARIEFDGTVNSTVFGQPGGKLWFYSPNGIVVGATASFNVGGLVLTTNPIDTTGGLYGPSGEIRFRGAAGSTGLVQVMDGASITASRNALVTGDQAYVALVAPRVVQGGTVQADGSVGYIAAEDADITINAGLFDIFVNSGTTDANGVVHTGTTTGAASTGIADKRAIYMVAVPKNDGLTMLLGGSIGYAAAASATDDGAAVILSAGHLGYDSGDPLANPANISIGDATFSSLTTANASDSITVSPTTLTRFDRFATLNAFKSVSLTAAGTAQIQANDTTGLPVDVISPPASPLYALDVFAGQGPTGGTVTLTTSGSGAFSAAGRVRLRADGLDDPDIGIGGTGGAVNVNVLGGSFSAPVLELSASGTGTYFSGSGTGGSGGDITILSQADFNTNDLIAVASGIGANGGDGNGGSGGGGSVSLTANGGTITTQSITLSASGLGGGGVLGGGAGHGGSVTATVTGNGTIGAPAGFTANASGIGASGDGQGGNGSGGDVTLTGTLGVLDFTTVNLSALGIGGSTAGLGGNAGGNGTGGTIGVSLAGTSQSWGSLFADASASAGASFGIGAPAGNAQGNLASGVTLDIQGVTLDLTGVANLHNDAFGQTGNGPGSLAHAGRAAVSVGSGGTLNANSSLVVSANAGFSINNLDQAPDYTPTMTGGLASVVIDGGNVSTPALTVQADAIGLGAVLGAGSANGGDAQVIVRGNGSLDVFGAFSAPGAILISADARGDYATLIGSVFGTVDTGFASAAQGGDALLQLDSGTITSDDFSISATGVGGPSATIGGADSLGSGSGGSALVAVNGGTLTSNGGLTADASGRGGTITGGARGGAGNGGTAALDATGGTVNLNGGDLTLLADGRSRLVSGSTTGSAGNATGGEARLTSQGTVQINVPNFVTLSARGIANSGSGSDGSAGIASGGLATIRAQGGTMALGDTEVDASAIYGSGLAPQTGINRAGTARVEASGGTIGITGDLSLSSNAAMTAERLDYHGEDGAGNQALLLASNGGIVTVSGATRIDATGAGGLDTLASGVGGNGTGGSIQVQALSGGAITLSSDVVLHANGYGADGRGTGGLGGAGFGGSASVSQGSGGTVHVLGGLTVDTNAYGGDNAVISTLGGRATGGTSTITALSGTLRIDGDATLTSDTIGGANPDASLAPTVAGLISLGTGTTSPGGTISIGGALNATALGDAARPDGSGVTGTIGGGAIVVTGDTNLNATGSINLGTLQVGGITTLRSTLGAVTVADLLTTSAVDVTATALNIASSGALTFANADATAGDLSLDAAGDLVLATVDATGAVTLRSRNGAVTANSPVNGNSITMTAGTNVTTNGTLTGVSLIDITAGGSILTNAAIDPAVLRLTAGTSITTNATATGGTVALNAGTGIAVNAGLTATTTLDMTAAGTLTVNALATGTQITARSADIVIGANGQIGQRGTTQSVNLINGAGGNPSFLGSAGGGTGYSLDNAELLRVFADNAIRFSVAGTAPAAVSIGNLALTFGANGNIGSGGTFGLSSAGLITVNGNLALTTSGANDTLQVNAGRFDIVTDTGSLALMGANGTMLGALNVTAGTFAVGTSAALAQLIPGGNIFTNSALMDAPGTAPARGGVVVGSIRAAVSNGFYVQNSGTTSAYADRRGFNAGALAINTASNATQIVVNGVTINAAGVPVTGLDTVGTITINGAVAAGGGRFNPRSSVNGCMIGRNCLIPDGPLVPTKPDLTGPIDPPGTSDNPTFINDSILQVEVRKNTPSTLLPLVDEPVTGVGNEDLWGDRCASGKEACEGGN